MSSGTIPDGARVRDRAAERIMLSRRLDRALNHDDAAAYVEAVLGRLDAQGANVSTVKPLAALLREIAEELLDVGGWATVLAYAHPSRSPLVDDALRDAVRLAARGWRSMQAATELLDLAEREGGR